jgi:hypothetical protein
MSLSKQVKALVKFLLREASLKGSNIFSKRYPTIIHSASHIHILTPRICYRDIEEAVQKLKFEKVHDVNALIDIMRTECYLLLKGPKLYQIVDS